MMSSVLRYHRQHVTCCASTWPLDELDCRIFELDREIARRAREDEVAGIGPIAATAIAALAPAMETFRRGRDFAAWLGLTPATEVDRRQAQARAHLEDGRAHPEAPWLGLKPLPLTGCAPIARRWMSSVTRRSSRSGAGPTTGSRTVTFSSADVNEQRSGSGG